MKITMIVATSKDGFIANNENPDPKAWTSKEDKDFLKNMVQKSTLMVFGKNTYEVYGPMTDTGKLRVVLCKDPEQFIAAQVRGQLEFKNMSPSSFFDHYSHRYSSCLLLGGAYVYRSFYDAGLIDEIFATVEPVIFKDGIRPFGDASIESLAGKPAKITPLNAHGTILQHFVMQK